jgi:hypothetical protein
MEVEGDKAIDLVERAELLSQGLSDYQDGKWREASFGLSQALKELSKSFPKGDPSLGVIGDYLTKANTKMDIASIMRQGNLW